MKPDLLQCSELQSSERRHVVKQSIFSKIEILHSYLIFII